MGSQARTFLPLVCTLLLGACVSPGPGDLSSGASVSDVIARMGKPSSELPLADGGRQLEYLRGPCGHYTFMVNVGLDGKVRAIDQVLRDAYFAKILPGMTEPEVLALIGHPLRTLTFEQINDAIWTYRYTESGIGEAWLNVHYDLSGKVTWIERRKPIHNHRGLCDNP